MGHTLNVNLVSFDPPPIRPVSFIGLKAPAGRARNPGPGNPAQDAGPQRVLPRDLWD